MRVTRGKCGTRSSRSAERERAGGEQEGKRDLKALHSTFAKAEGETVLPDKAEHLILPPQRVDTAFPHPASQRYCHAVYHLVSAKQDLLPTFPLKLNFVPHRFHIPCSLLAHAMKLLFRNADDVSAGLQASCSFGYW